MLVKLFLIFFKLGFFSFGGGYVMLPLIEQELQSKGISVDPSMISNITAIAGVAPGPIGINASVAFGYNIAGILGVLVSFLGVALPSLIIVITVAIMFEKIYKSKYFKWALDGLKPIIVGLIGYAAISQGMKNGMFLSNIGNAINNGANIFTSLGDLDIKSIIIILVALIFLAKTKVHPILIIIGGGLVGLLLFS